ncbi:MAG: erythromycin esterase family protein, partial [Bacteroidales bacterium]
EKLSNELQQYKDQKIIIWVANLHALYDNKRYTSKNKKYTFISFGERLKKRYPNQSYTICFTSYLNMEEGRITQKASRQTWESAIHTKEFPYIFLNFREFPNEKIFNKNMKMRCNQLNNLSANWSQMTDGIFYIDTSHQTTKYE